METKDKIHGGLAALTAEQRAALAKAQALQIRRERWKTTLDALPMPKSGATDFPYESLDEALDDGFQKLEGGSARLIQLAKKAWKTEQWREQADRNRKMRDKLADGPDALAEIVKK